MHIRSLILKKKSTIHYLLGVIGLTLFSSNICAQTTASATVNVVLADVRSIKINPTQSVVTLNFNSASDYTNGVTSQQNAHLEVTSTGGYIIKVKASNANLQNNTNTIPVSTINISPKVNSSSNIGSAIIGSYSNTMASTYLYPANLTVSPSLIIESSKGSPKTMYDIQYKASGGVNYMNKAPGNYSVTITYSIEPQ